MKYDWIIILVIICGSRDWGWGWGPFFFSLSLSSPCRWVAPHIAVTRTFAPKNGKFLCKNFMYELGAPSISTPGWLHAPIPSPRRADYVVKDSTWLCLQSITIFPHHLSTPFDSHLKHVLHILHMFCTFPEHILHQSSHIISETDHTKHMAACPTDRPKKNLLKSRLRWRPRCPFHMRW